MLPRNCGTYKKPKSLSNYIKCVLSDNVSEVLGKCNPVDSEKLEKLQQNTEGIVTTLSRYSLCLIL